MHSTLIAIVLILLCWHPRDVKASSAPQPVTIETGRIQGVFRQAPSGQIVVEHRGIPYAKSPTGERRWSLPQPAERWTGTLDARHFGPACPQVPRFKLTDASLDEDCLSINVTAPGDMKKGEKLPVLFWIHGGAFVGGSSNLYRLDKLASEGRMVVVSANYRLGLLGFVPLPGLSNHSVNGNFGIEDQREALRWVQRNIRAFGGDPDNVTIVGESAGGGSVCVHLSSPDQVKGLFHKAIIVSAGCLVPLKTVSESVETIGNVLAKDLGCQEDPDLVCLRSKSVLEILHAQTKFANEHPTELAMFTPTYGTTSHPNSTFPTSIVNALDQKDGGKWMTVPLLVGAMQKELLLYVAYWWQNALAGKGPSLDQSSIRQFWLPNFYGQHANAVAQEYGMDDPKAGAHRFGEVLSDFNPMLPINHCLYYRTTTKINAYPGARPSYVFEFSDPDALVKGVGIAPPYPDFSLGPVHSAILNYWFPYYSNNSKINAPALPPKSQALANQMIQYLAAFVRNGDPNRAGLTQWPVYKNSQHVMKFSTSQIGPFDGGAAHRCDWWNTLFSNH